MTRTKIIKSNQSQIIHLSKAVAFPENIKEVEVIVVGNTRVITPVEQSWDSWFDTAPVSYAFMKDREQPKLQDKS